MVLVLSALVLFPRAQFDDGCDFGGDTWEYQAIAVNYALGHGFPVFASLEPFPRYRFGRNQDKSSPELLAQFQARRETTPHFFRAPGYPFFLGAVYRIGGISPRTAKRVQLGLLIIVAAALPLLGALCWGSRGSVAGALAGPCFLAQHAGHAARLLTECLLAFWVLLVVAALVLWSRRATAATTALAGLAVGTGLLIKGWFYPLVPLLVLLAVHRVRRRVLSVRLALAFAILLVLPGLLWSVYATARSGRWTFICLQGADVILASNNERSLPTGGWHPEGVLDPGSFYQRADVLRRPWPVQVLLFSAEHAAEMPGMMMRKVSLAYQNRIFAQLVMAFFCLELVRDLARRLRARLKPDAVSDATGRFARAAATFGAVLVVLDLVGGWLWAGPTLNEGILLAAAAALAAASAGTGGGIPSVLPAAFALVLLNSLLVTLIFHGNHRFIWPVDALFALAAGHYLVALLSQVAGLSGLAPEGVSAG